MKKIFLTLFFIFSSLYSIESFGQTLVTDQTSTSIIHRIKDGTIYMIPNTINCSNINAIDNQIYKINKGSGSTYQGRVTPTHTQSLGTDTAGCVNNMLQGTAVNTYVFNNYNNDNTIYFFRKIDGTFRYFSIVYYIDNITGKYSIFFLGRDWVNGNNGLPSLQFASIYDSSYGNRIIFYTPNRKFFSFGTNFDFNQGVGIIISDNIISANGAQLLEMSNNEYTNYVYGFNNSILSCGRVANNYNVYSWNNDATLSNHQSIIIPAYKGSINFGRNCFINYESNNNVATFSHYLGGLQAYSKSYTAGVGFFDYEPGLYITKIENGIVKGFNFNTSNFTNYAYQPNNNIFSTIVPFVGSNKDENNIGGNIYKLNTNQFIYTNLELVDNNINTPTLSGATTTTIDQNAITINPNINNNISPIINITVSGSTSSGSTGGGLTEENEGFFSGLFSDTFGGIGDAIGSAFGGIGDAIGWAFGGIVGAFEYIGDAIGTAFGGIVGAFEYIGDAIGTAFGGIGNFFTYIGELFDMVSASVLDFWEFIKSIMNIGNISIIYTTYASSPIMDALDNGTSSVMSGDTESVSVISDIINVIKWSIFFLFVIIILSIFFSFFIKK